MNLLCTYEDTHSPGKIHKIQSQGSPRVPRLGLKTILHTQEMHCIDQYCKAHICNPKQKLQLKNKFVPSCANIIMQ